MNLSDKSVAEKEPYRMKFSIFVFTKVEGEGLINAVVVTGHEIKKNILCRRLLLLNQ